jgi:hypothetical protein
VLSRVVTQSTGPRGLTYHGRHQWIDKISLSYLLSVIRQQSFRCLATTLHDAMF